MIIEIDYNSSEAIYSQLKNRIIMAIALEELRQGDNLPSVRDMANLAGINMHTVNKAYAILRDEGYLTINRRGAVVNISSDNSLGKQALNTELRQSIARAISKGLSADECREVLESVIGEFYK